MAAAATMARVRSSLRYLFSDFIGEVGGDPPCLPIGLPDSAVAIVRAGIDLLIDYQGASYAQLYVDRLQRYVGRHGLDAATFCEMARLMALRMSYQDPIRIAQLKLAESAMRSGDRPARPAQEIKTFRLDELIGALPAAIAEPLLDALEWIGRTHQPVAISFSTTNRFGIARLKIEAALRRWRLFSVRYSGERLWVERWLHMISRALEKQPKAVATLVATATMIQGYGDAYRQGLADWHAIIDGLVKPTFDGMLPLTDLAAAVTEARHAATSDPRQAALKRSIGEIRARALADGTNAAANRSSDWAI
jgi:hypothetical protein